MESRGIIYGFRVVKPRFFLETVITIIRDWNMSPLRPRSPHVRMLLPVDIPVYPGSLKRRGSVIALMLIE